MPSLSCSNPSWVRTSVGSHPNQEQLDACDVDLSWLSSALQEEPDQQLPVCSNDPPSAKPMVCVPRASALSLDVLLNSPSSSFPSNEVDKR